MRTQILDAPVGSTSDPAAIHGWLDELERLRREHRRSPSIVAAIDEELSRVVGWLRARDELAGRTPPGPP